MILIHSVTFVTRCTVGGNDSANTIAFSLCFPVSMYFALIWQWSSTSCMLLPQILHKFISLPPSVHFHFNVEVVRLIVWNWKHNVRHIYSIYKHIFYIKSQNMKNDIPLSELLSSIKYCIWLLLLKTRFFLKLCSRTVQCLLKLHRWALLIILHILFCLLFPFETNLWRALLCNQQGDKLYYYYHCCFCNQL